MQFTDEQKQLIDNESTNKQVIISFPNTEIENITNSKIYAEEMSLEGSLLDQDNFAIGKCNSDLFKVKVADFNEDIMNQEMVVTVKFTNESMGTELEVPFGRFVVNTIPERTSDRRYLIISAQDFMIKFDVDISTWYNTVLFTEEVTERTVKEILSMLCSYVGVEYDTTFELLHGDLVVKKNIEPTQLSGRDFLQQICELNACFGHFNELGILSFVVLNSNANTTEISPYKNVDYEDYRTEKINSVQIRLEEDDIGATYTEDGATNINQLTITGNSLLFHLSSEELTSVAQAIYNQIKDISFTPNETLVKGGNYFNYGDKYLVNAKIPMENEVIVNTIESYVLTKSINGIQGMSTLIGAKGSQYQPQIANDIVTQMKIINGRSAKVKADMDSLKTEYKDFEKNVSSTIEQQAEEISLKVSKGDVISEINQSAEEVKIDADKITLDGDTTVKSGFSLKVGDVGGFEISENDIHKGTDSLTSTEDGVYIGTDGIRTVGLGGSVTHANHYSRYNILNDDRSTIISAGGIGLYTIFKTDDDGSTHTYPSDLTTYKNGIPVVEISDNGIKLNNSETAEINGLIEILDGSNRVCVIDKDNIWGKNTIVNVNNIYSKGFNIRKYNDDGTIRDVMLADIEDLLLKQDKLGKAITDGYNIDEIVDSFFAWVNTSNVTVEGSLPPFSAFYLLHLKTSSTASLQIAFPYSSNYVPVFREYVNNQWYEWRSWTEPRKVNSLSLSEYGLTVDMYKSGNTVDVYVSGKLTKAIASGEYVTLATLSENSSVFPISSFIKYEMVSALYYGQINVSASSGNILLGVARSTNTSNLSAVPVDTPIYVKFQYLCK